MLLLASLCAPLLRAALLLALLFAVPVAASAQVNIGADLMSRYVWRGFDFGESFSIQPTLEYSEGPLTAGTWASYSLSADGGTANEHDLYISLSGENFSVGVTDYYFPSGGPAYLDQQVTSPEFFSGEAHVLEPFASVTGPATFPVTLYGAVNVTNDDDYSTYLEASIPFTVEGVQLGLSAGVIPMASAYYGTTGPALTKAALSASKAIPITDEFALPVGVSYIINPYTERTFLVFGISL